MGKETAPNCTSRLRTSGFTLIYPYVDTILTRRQLDTRPLLAYTHWRLRLQRWHRVFLSIEKLSLLRNYLTDLGNADNRPRVLHRRGGRWNEHCVVQMDNWGNGIYIICGDIICPHMNIRPYLQWESKVNAVNYRSGTSKDYVVLILQRQRLHTL